MLQRKRFELVIPEPMLELMARGKCPICKKKNNRPYKTCSRKCSEKFYKVAQVHDWNDVKRKCFERDNYCCVECGRSDSIEADHIFPICLGGDEFDLKNTQTLCVEHHKEKTKADKKLIAEVKRKMEKLKNGQMLLPSC